MSQEILQLEPKRVWYYFNEICKIPHASENEEDLRNYIVDIAKKLGLEYKVDKKGNLVVKKPANNSKSSKIVVLQGHLDMICEAVDPEKRDPSKDPIKPYIDGEWVKGEGTSLGADNGISLAMCLVILESKDLVHGPLECLMTVEEETGLVGATALSSDMIEGRTMINMDSEEDGILYIGCAGGKIGFFRMPYKKTSVPNGYVGLEISVSGMLGGHSGVEIHKQRGNANKVLARIIDEVKKKYDVMLSSFEAGAMHNVIPSFGFAEIAVEEKNKQEVEKIIMESASVIKAELSEADPDCKVDVKEAKIEKVIEKEYFEKIIHFINKGPHGVFKMSPDIEGLPETSANLAKIKTEENDCYLELSVRSSIETEKHIAMEKFETLAKSIEAKLDKFIEYPSWQPNIKSPLLNVCKKVLKDMYGKDPHVTAMHAGLECGVVGSKYKGMDMISYGPDLQDVHSVNEQLHIKTTQSFWTFIIKTLEELAKE